MRTIRFFSTVDGVADAYPIIPASEYIPNWVATAREGYLKAKKEAQGEKFHHLYRCPGIFDLMSIGYIVPMPWEVLIETKGDGADFKWVLPDKSIPYLYEGHVVVGHMAQGMAASLPKKDHCLKSLIKFNTPWHVVAPPDVKFMVIPIPYPDDYIFECNTGLLDPGYSTEINPQGWWSILDGQHIVKAGTPMCQLIPLTTEKFKMTIGTATEKEIAWTKKREYFFGLSFSFKRTLAKAMYLKHFFGKS